MALGFLSYMNTRLASQFKNSSLTARFSSEGVAARKTVPVMILADVFIFLTFFTLKFEESTDVEIVFWLVILWVFVINGAFILTIIFVPPVSCI